jgi:hypothetical protein
MNLRHPSLAVLALSCAFASANVHGAAGWTGQGRIAEVQVNEFGRILVRLDAGGNPSGCRESAWFYRENSGGTDQMLEMLLAAVQAGRPVAVYVTGLCHLKGYSEISAVALSP